jgi:hypothetical protein
VPCISRGSKDVRISPSITTSGFSMDLNHCSQLEGMIHPLISIFDGDGDDNGPKGCPHCRTMLLSFIIYLAHFGIDGLNIRLEQDRMDNSSRAGNMKQGFSLLADDSTGSSFKFSVSNFR